MKKPVHLLFLLTFQLSNSIAQTPGFEWVHTHGGTLTDYGSLIKADYQDNVYTVGYYSGTVDFDPGPGVANLSDDYNIFVQRLNSNGNLMWGKSFPDGSEQVFLTSIAVDASNNVIIGGFFTGTITFTTLSGNETISSLSNRDPFIVKMNANGDFLWAKSFQNPNVEGLLIGLQVDDTGNIYSTGRFKGSCDFDPGPGTANVISSGGSLDLFICKLSPGGDFVWVKKIGAGGLDEGVAVAIKGSTVLVTGGFQSSVDFDPSAATNTINSEGDSDLFLLSLTTDGDFNWVKNMGSTAEDMGIDIILTDNSEIYLTGTFNDTIDLDPGIATNTVTANEGENSFIMKLNVTGDFIWARTFTGTSNKRINTMALLPNNRVVVTGTFDGTADFDCGTGTNNLTSIGNLDAFLVYLDQNGNYIWAGSFGNTGPTYGDIAYDITADNQGNVYYTGSFHETLDFDCGPGINEQTALGSADIYIVKINSNVLAVNENTLKDFKLYPNPSSRDLFISAGNLDHTQLIICNALGKIVLEKELSGTEAQLDIQSLSPGSYVVHLTNDSGSQHQTFIKTN